ncbi:hypothetical protein BDM02DRAFT_3114164 [Thelephora ganbajun]|uniref:Uncharacterized protein n=1 Tax=Thelephora ganbajun TaxID=370292 RepID=A0ACB6ZJ92_THEGA|nr:hypothetical protein BDM02DRAFT_3114164 [Thelephora ganbajun]
MRVPTGRCVFGETLKNDPLEYQRVCEELRIEAALVVGSPYAEDRAVVDNRDDQSRGQLVVRFLRRRQRWRISISLNNAFLVGLCPVAVLHSLFTISSSLIVPSI